MPAARAAWMSSAKAFAEDIKAAEDALQSVMDKMVSVKGLKEAIADAKTYKKSDYSKESFAALKVAIEAAEEAAVKADASKEEIAAAEEMLAEAVSGLRVKSKGALVAGTYEISQSLRKSTDTASQSMAAPVFGEKASVRVSEDGTAEVTLRFNSEAQIMNITCHPLGIDIYDEAGSKVDVIYETMTVDNLYNKFSFLRRIISVSR